MGTVWVSLHVTGAQLLTCHKLVILKLFLPFFVSVLCSHLCASNLSFYAFCDHLTVALHISKHLPSFRFLLCIVSFLLWAVSSFLFEKVPFKLHAYFRDD